MADRTKIRLRSFPQITPDPDYVRKTWEALRSAIKQIQNLRDESELSYEELYRFCYNLLLHKEGARLYAGLEEVVHEHMQVLAARMEEAIANNEFLNTLSRTWDEHQTTMIMIRDILLYLDRAYVKDERETVYELGLQQFYQQVIHRPPVRDHLRNTLLELIRQERNGDVVDRGKIKTACNMLVVLGINSRRVYEELFERHFLQQAADFYRVEAQKFLQDQNVSIYLKKVEDRLNEEIQRVHHYLDQNSRAKIVNVVEDELLTKHQEELLAMENSGIVYMIENEKIEDLQRAYRLFKRIPHDKGLQLVCNFVREHLESQGRSLVQNDDANKNPTKFVQSLLDLKERFDRFLRDAFFNDDRIRTAINAAFTNFINDMPRSPEYVSLFIDDKLKRGVKEMSEADVELIMDKTISIFRFLQDKDVFERYYKQHLAKRLLLNRTASDEAERSVIARLKVECGFHFTNKLEGMFRDMSVSNDTMDSFREFIATRPALTKRLNKLDLHVRVLTTVNWPTSPSPRCLLPVELRDACEVFEEFYHHKHNGRKLTWQTNLGSVDLDSRFGGGKRHHILTVSTHQAVVLLLFNTAGELSYEEIRVRTDMGDGELKRLLQSLACGKTRVLTKTPMSRDIGDQDVFAFNDAFTSKLKRVKIQQIVSRETAPERDATKAKVDEDRKFQIEACIVRVMKARRTMHHNTLVAEVTEQLASRFVPTPTAVKKRIESLLEREYLERSATDRNDYNYVA